MSGYLQASTTVDAPPEAVWEVVSDLPRMASWSPQCARMFVLGGPLQQGSRTVNVNRAGWRVWPTTAKVITMDAPHRIAFRVVENRAVWSYELRPEGSGTLLTERREVPDGTTWVSQRLIDLMLGGDERLDRNLQTGMERTLSGIKQAVEQEHRRV